MYENRQAAIRLKDLLTDLRRVIDKGTDLVLDEEFSLADRKFFLLRMAKFLGTEFAEIENEIHKEHPDLVPPGWHVPN